MRWKLIAGNLAALLVVGLASWLWVRSQVADALGRDVDATVEHGAELLDAVRTTDGEAFKNVVVAGAARPDVQAIFALGSEQAQRDAAYGFVGTYAHELRGLYPAQNIRDADIVVVTDADGVVLARKGPPALDRSRNLRREFEVVDYALTTGPARDFLSYDQQQLYDIAVAPVVIQGVVKGVLLVGYEIADSMARNDYARLGVDVGYLVRDVHGRFILASLSVANATQVEKDALGQWANSPAADLARLFNDPGEPVSPVRDVVVNGDTYRLSARAMPGVLRPRRPSQVRPGYIVLRNLSATRAPSNTTTLPIVWMSILGVLLIAGYNLAMASYLLKPIEQIEDGLLRIINGDKDHRIELQHVELGGIVDRVNQLVSELTGAEEEADESGRISQHAPPAGAAPARPDPSPPIIDDASIGTFNPGGNPADAQLSAQLSGEAESDYYDRLRREYNQARQRAGLGGDGLSHEQFVESVRASEQQLAQKYGLVLVRFQVQAQGSQVVFRAIPIR